MPKKNEKLFRTFQMRAESSTEGERTLTLSFSSEEPYMRWGEYEILGHSDKEIDLDWLKSGNAPLLLDHDPEKQIGVVRAARIEDGRGIADVKFSRSAQDIFDDIQDGIRSNVSVGYRVEAIERESSIDENPAYRVTSWKPFEISIVSIPADQSVGTNRSDKTTVEEEPKMDPIEVNNSREEALLAERTRIAEITRLGRQAGIETEADKAVEDGTSAEDFCRRAFDVTIANAKQKSDEAIRSEAVEIRDVKRSFSIFRALDAHMSGDWQKAGYEREVSEFLKERYNRHDSQRILLPMSLRATQVAGTDAAGGFLVGDDHRGDLFIDVLRNALRLSELGATVLTGLDENIEIPKLLSGVALQFVDENAAANEGAPQWGQLRLEPKTVSGNIPISRRLMVTNNPDAESILRNDMMQGVAIAVETAAYKGGGTHEPTGIIETTGVNGVQLESASAPTWNELVAMETKVATNNALMGNLAYVTTPTIVGNMKTTKKDAGSGIFLVENGISNGYTVQSSNCVASGNLIFGNFADLLIGQFGAIEIVPVRSATTGGLQMGIFLDVDVAVRRPQSFTVASDSKTST